ncbi:peptidylprolyl isomerase [Hellea sp.]|nr:peptidylprolyl isomerase [Hellea sp.]
MTDVIGFHYTLKSDAGEVLDSSSGGHPMLYLAGSGQILPALDKEMSEMKVGDTKSVTLSPKEAYGVIKPELKMNVKLGQFPPGTEVKPGLQFRINSDPRSPMFRVINVLGEEVFIDGNHELAGETLHFDIEVTEKRKATKDEIAHGHAHGAGGHHH